MISLLSGVYLYNSFSSPSYKGKQCYFEGTQCTLENQDQIIKVAFLNQQIEIEEELQLNIQYPAHFALNQAWVEGTNMFMGKMNVELSEPKLDGDNVMSNGVLFLGSCSEPNMRWRLVLEFKVSGKTLTEKYYFNFQTDRG